MTFIACHKNNLLGGGLEIPAIAQRGPAGFHELSKDFNPAQPITAYDDVCNLP